METTSKTATYLDQVQGTLSTEESRVLLNALISDGHDEIVLEAARSMCDSIEDKERTIRSLIGANNRLNDMVTRFESQARRLQDLTGKGTLGKKHPYYKEFISKAFYEEFVKKA